MRGGKRKGSGRKFKGWIKICTAISPKANEYLNKKKKEGINKSVVIDEALKNHEEKTDVKR